MGNYPGIESKNKYNLDTIENGLPQACKLDDHIMVGPKYPGIEEAHEYNPPSRRNELPTVELVNAPVYIDDGANKYCNIPEKQYGEIFHALPLHPNVEAKNCYSPQEEKQPGQLVMAGPKFVGVDDQCKYNPDLKKADTEGLMGAGLNGPKFQGIPGGSLYNIAPCYPGITAENKFGPASMGY